MRRRSQVTVAALLSILCLGASASAETLRCQSVNGNLNCAGSGGVSCQTINGRKTCTSGHGDVVQSFGNGAPSDAEGSVGGDEDMDDAWSAAPPRHRPQDHRSWSRLLELQRQGAALHPDAD